MRVFLPILALVMMGCASTPEAPPVPESAIPAAAATDAATPASGEELLKAIETALSQGYKIVNEDGEKLYCRKEPKTGSRVRSNFVCLTEDRLLAAQQGAQDFLENVQRGPNRRRD